MASASWAAPDGGDTGGTDNPCPPKSPILSGPDHVDAGEGYSISWTNVLGDSFAADSYTVQRSTDPGFGTAVESYLTGRNAYGFPPVGTLPAAPVLYHRIVVKSLCPTAGLAPVVSNVLAVAVSVECPTPDPVGDLTVSPESPPAWSTYVVSWGTLGSGGPGPGGGQTGLKFRLRRTAGGVVQESLSDTGSASFSDPPGTYAYQVRAEADCGSVGSWSPVTTVVVGAPPSTVVLVADPKPIFVIANPTTGTVSGSTSFSVRNVGTDAVSIEASTDDGELNVTPAAFLLAPGAVQQLTVVLTRTGTSAATVTATVTLDASGYFLRVPVRYFVAESAAAAPVVWDAADADVDQQGDPILRKIINPNTTPAAFLASIQQPWVSVESPDGTVWNRLLAPLETRTVRIRIDRSKRRAPTGTETSAISLVTAGLLGSPSVLVITDDGPVPTVSVAPGGAGGPSPGGSLPRRVLFPSLPNANDAMGIGRFVSDLWLSNTDAVNPIDVQLVLMPVLPARAPGPGITTPPTQRVINLTLPPGQTRRFRNLLGLISYEGACSLELRSAAATLTATAIVNNEPLSPAPAALRTALASGGASITVVTPASGVFGSEMRPVAPGEGAKVLDPQFVLSGLIYDANRRTNVLLTETTGLDTTVLLRLYNGENGSPVLKGGQPVVMTVAVPGGQTVQINAPELWDDPSQYTSAYYYALVTWQPGTSPGGAVVPLATVIDNRTQDSSLRVGVSTRNLDPTLMMQAPAAATGGRQGLAGTPTLSALPFGGGPAPLFFPVVHSVGAPLAGSVQPVWKTRVTMTNIGSTDHQVILTVLDQTKNTPIGVASFPLHPNDEVHFEDLLTELYGLPAGGRAYGGIRVEAIERTDGTWASTWKDIDIQTEVYTADPNPPDPAHPGEFKTGMEAYPYWHGYSSFQSNLGAVQVDGAETSSRFRTNLILQEVGGASCELSVAAYQPGTFVPLAQTIVTLAPYDYFSQELFHSVLGLDLTELTDIRVVVRQVAGDGVFMGFASKINLATGDPANIFLRPAMAGTGR